MTLIKRLEEQQEVYDGTYVRLPHSFVEELKAKLREAQNLVDAIHYGVGVKKLQEHIEAYERAGETK